MKLYLAMWARGAAGNQVTRQEMEANKQYAISVAERIAHATETFHEVVCPHADPELNKIDDKWLETRDEQLVPKAMQRCYDLLDDCQAILVIHRGYTSDGMDAEIKRAKRDGKLVWKKKDLTDETLEDLILFLNEREV